jgi:hypothetical protein
MSRNSKLLEKLLSGREDKNIRFDELTGLLKRLGFRCRTRGSHNIFNRDGVQERINLQSDGAMAKRYQVKQVRDIIVKHGLEEQNDE